MVFELLNEVTEPHYIDTWNRVSNEAIRRIRVYAPNTVILVGSYHHNSAAAVTELAPPQDDRVVYNFHCYEPMRYTHQGAGWVPPLAHLTGVTCEDSGVCEALFEGVFAPAIEAALDNHTALYCGEYGVIDVVPPQDAIKWFRAINAVFEKHGIARCAWSYKQMDFGLCDASWDELRGELVKVL